MNHRALAAVLVGVAVVVPLALGLPPAWALAALAAAVLAGLLAVPVSWLPALALLLWVLVPVGYLQLPVLVSRFTSPAVVVLAVWCLRVGLLSRSTRRRSGRDLALLVAMALLAAWSVRSTLHSVSPARSLAWLADLAVVLVAGYLGSRADGATRRRLVGAWTAAAIAIGVFAVIEWWTKDNPLAHYYVIDGLPIGQRWSVYRVLTTLGHPLLNATFFAVSTAFFTVRTAHRFTGWGLAAAVLSMAGLLVSVSRGATLGLAAGLAAAVALHTLRSSAPASRKLGVLALCGVVVFAVSASPLLAQRSASAEGSASSAQRSLVTDAALQVARADGWLGSGPGTAQQRMEMTEPGLVVEDSAAQLLISMGIPGCALVGLVLLLVAWEVVLSARWEVLAAVVAYLAAVFSFNAWDSNPGTLLPLALLLVLGREREAAPVARPAVPALVHA